MPAFPRMPASSCSNTTHERISGIKDSSGELDSLQKMIDAARDSERDDLSVMIGNASALAAGLEMGAAGAVLAVGNVAPRVCAGIASLAASGRHAEAAEWNIKLDPLAQAVTRRHGIGGLKAALDRLGWFGGDPRPPLPPAPAAAREEIAALLKDVETFA